jgi:hypothetical protein
VPFRWVPFCSAVHSCSISYCVPFLPATTTGVSG